MHFHDKVYVGIPVCDHVAVEEVDVCLVEFLSVF